MTLAIVRPRVVFYSERVGGRPLCRCMSAGLSTVLRFEGYDVPKDFPVTLYEAANVSGCGLGFPDLRHALDVVLPEAPVSFGTLDIDSLWKFLRYPRRPNRRKGTVLVAAHMSRLPSHLQRLVGFSWIADNKYPNDLHGIAIAGKRWSGNVRQVLWMDTMGQAWKGYAGTWEPWDDVKHALWANSSGVHVAFGEKGSAV